MSDLSFEEMMPLSQLAKKLGRSDSTIRRWANGVTVRQGGEEVEVRLDTMRHTDGRYTTLSAYRAFIGELNGSARDK